MATRKPLSNLIPEIIQYFQTNLDYLQFNQKLYKVYQGQVRQDVEASLQQEIISQAAYNRAIKRIPSINVINKTVQKLSKVYAHSPKRLTDNELDKEIMDNIIKLSDIDMVLHTANEMVNLHKGCLIEPYLSNGIVKFRVLAFHQFLPFSDDINDPTNMTVLIKLMGQENKVIIEQRFDEYGNKLDTNDEQVRLVDILALYSDDEFMIIDSTGSIRYDKMAEMGINSTKNPFGVIPACYVNTNKFEILPYPNQAGYDISILVPKLLTDLNYAAQYMSHSIIWTRNTEINGQEINPDAIVDLGDRTEDGGDPEMGSIDPKVEIEQILQLIEFELSAYFSSIGIKTSTTGSMMPGREASGFAKAMDEGDATQERQVQIQLFKQVEKHLWNLISKMQNVWSRLPELKERRRFTPGFIDSFSIKFAEMKILKSDQQKLEEIKMQQDQKLMSRRQALKMLHPDFTEKQLDNWEKELDDFEEDKLNKMLDFNSAQQDSSEDSEDVPRSNENRDEQESQRKETMGK